MSKDSPASKAGMTVKVYLVCQFLNLTEPGKPNIEILCAKLTRQAAQSIVDQRAGTFVQKHVADK